MFTKVEGFSSLNQPATLRAGVYVETRSHYQTKNGSVATIVREFTRVGDDAPSICDLIVIVSGADILFRDFMVVPGGLWRDSYGNLSEQLATLFPSFGDDQRLVERETGEEFEFSPE